MSNAGKAGKALHNRPQIMAPAEFGLVVECCRWPNDPRRADAIGTAAANIDWPSFLATAERHRVTGLCWNALHSLGVRMPEPASAVLAKRANSIAAHGLQAAAESARLSAALDRASIPHLFVKGLPVGALAYGSPFIKHSWDIDVLVGEDGVEQGASILHNLGFKLIFPKFGRDWGRLMRWHHVQKDSAWRHEASGMIVELHSRLSDNRRLIPAIDLSSPRQFVAITDGISLPTLALDEMFAHLCVHGASSAWFRLKWIGDLAALIARTSADVDHLYRRSQELGAGRAAAQALLLAHRLFDTTIDDRLLRELDAGRANRWLADTAFAQLLLPEPGARWLGTAAIHITQLFLLPGARFKLAEARRQISAAMSNLLD
jgi:hypothetical protein